MARERFVTRTVELAEVSVMCLNTMTAEVCTRIFTVSGVSKKENELLSLARKEHETDTFKLVATTAVEYKEVLYGMPEADFIKLAKVLPPRTATKEQE